MTNEERLKNWREGRRAAAAQAKMARLERAARRSEFVASARQESVEGDRRRDREVTESLLPTEGEVVSQGMDILLRRDLEATQKRKLRVVLFGSPMLFAVLYSIFWLTPLYEARTTFSVSSGATSSGGGGLGLLGFSPGAGMVEGYKVRDFLRSREAMRAVEEKTGFLSSFEAEGVDFLSQPHRIPFLGIDRYNFYQDRVKMSIDVQSGLVTLYVQGLAPAASIETSAALIELARERLHEFTAEINSDQLGALESKVEESRNEYIRAAQAVLSAQGARSNVDREQTSAAIYRLISSLELELSETRSRRASLVESGLINSPLLPGLDSRIAALDVQITAQKERLSGPSGQGAIAVDRTRLEDLVSQRDLEQQNLQFALMAREDARQRTLGQKLYLTVNSQPESQTVAVFKRTALYVALLSLVVGCVLLVGFQILEGLRMSKLRP